jgi:hypothetical protein
VPAALGSGPSTTPATVGDWKASKVPLDSPKSSYPAATQTGRQNTEKHTPSTPRPLFNDGSSASIQPSALPRDSPRLAPASSPRYSAHPPCRKTCCHDSSTSPNSSLTRHLQAGTRPNLGGICRPRWARPSTDHTTVARSHTFYILPACLLTLYPDMQPSCSIRLGLN